MREHIDAILMAFCDPELDDRFILPFRVGDTVYACDGRIIVRTQLAVACDLSDQPPAGADPTKLPWSGLAEPEVEWPSDIPELPDLTPVACRRCYGRGSRKCDMGHAHACDECEGSGKRMPDVRVGPVRVGPYYLSAINAALLRAVGAKVRPLAGYQDRLDGVRFAFTGDGFEGLVVGVSEGSESTGVKKMRRVMALREAVAAPMASAFV